MLLVSTVQWIMLSSTFYAEMVPNTKYSRVCVDNSIPLSICVSIRQNDRNLQYIEKFPINVSMFESVTGGLISVNSYRKKQLQYWKGRFL